MSRQYRQRVPPMRLQVANLILENHSFEEICRIAGITPASFLKHRLRIQEDSRIRVQPPGEKSSKIDIEIDKAITHLIELIRTKHASHPE